MKKKPPPARRPQDVMARFDRLLTAMAPKPEPPAKKPLAPRGTKKNSTPRRQDAK